jgi:hypothetical protein
MRSSGKVGHFEDKFSVDVATVDHLVRADGVPQRKHIDRRYADQPTVNQIGYLPNRLPSSLKVDNYCDLAEASPLGFLPIALDVTVCGRREDVDQSAAGPEYVQRLRQGGGPYGVQDGIDALSRPIANCSAYVFSLIVN